MPLTGEPDHAIQAAYRMSVLSPACSNTVYLAAKRAIDVILSALALVCLAPGLLLIALGILLDSPGAPLFVQERVGSRMKRRGGQAGWELTRFRCYKFRTMRAGADSGLHRAYMCAFIHNDAQAMQAIQGEATPVRKLIHDTRITRTGRWLRRLSLDELPQLWNVLMGDMSLVGPRPAIPYEVEAYADWHLKRLQAKPGLTGLWQVSARSASDFDDMVRLDIAYAAQSSLLLDLKIMLQTPLVMLRGHGAY